MIWRRCFRCGILFKGKACPNCSIKRKNLNKDIGIDFKDNFKTGLQKDIGKEIKEIQKNQDDYFGKGSEEVDF